MAVTNVVLRQRKGNAKLTGGKRVRTYQAIYHVKCSSINEDPETIMAHAEIPQLSPVSTWPTVSAAVLVGVDPQQNLDTPDHWVVTCDYTTNPDIRSEDAPAENPLLRPCVVSRSPQQRQRVLERDVDGNLIVNAADDKFVPPVEREEHPPSYTITKNILAWPHALEIAYADGINNDLILIPSKGISAAIGTMKFNGFSGSEQFENGFHFWSITAALEVNWEGWNAPILNCGCREKFVDDVMDVFIIPIIGANGEAVTDPVKLNSNGTKASAYASPNYLTFKKHREVPFADLLALFGL